MTVAALYVVPGGPYDQPGLDVDPWPESRDARLYAGPWPVVAHPPCAAWGAYSRPHPGSTARGPLRGDDAGTFKAALDAVRTWGGVLEHPRQSHAWAAFGLPAPVPGAQWTRALGEVYPGSGAAWVVEVDQGHYGHPARKPTWLYYVGRMSPFAVVRGASTPPTRPGPANRRGIVERMSRRQRLITPLPFRDFLIRLAEASR